MLRNQIAAISEQSGAERLKLMDARQEADRLSSLIVEVSSPLHSGLRFWPRTAWSETCHKCCPTLIQTDTISLPPPPPPPPPNTGARPRQYS